MKPFTVITRNYRIFGARYVLWDVVYQGVRKLHNVLQKEIIEDKKLMQKKVNDYEMFIYRKSKGIHRDLRLHATREAISVEIVKNLVHKGDIVLEAGANIGYYAILESKLVGKKGSVYAVEPIRENFELLTKNIALNKLRNVKPYHLAFNDRDTELEINIGSEGNLHTPRAISNRLRVERVKSVSIDSFFKNKKKPIFMRMDIEGYEDVVLSGAEKTLDSLEVIFVELHFPLIEKEKMIKLLKNLKSKNFEVYKTVIEWERWEEPTFLGKIVNFLHRKRSKPKVYTNLTIDKLIESKDFLEGHLCLEVFFIKNLQKV